MKDQPVDFDSIGQHCVAIVARARHLPVEAVTLDSDLTALEVDSLDKVSLSFDLEDAYNIDIPDSALFQIKTVGDIARGVWAALEKRAATEPAAAKDATCLAGVGSDENVAVALDGKSSS